MAICMPSAGDLFPHIFNLINSNIGVGLLAMPYCFHECGILLTAIILLLMSVATYFSCVLILKTTHQLKCDSLERAAFKSHGVAGKRIVDLCVIGLLFGMLVGLNVAISDLGSEIFDTLYGGKASLTVRRSVLLFTIFIVLPFCCLRRVVFLSTSSFLAVFLYVTFLLNLLCNYAIPKMQSKQFTFGYFRLWRPQGLVHCVPIIASSVCCQVQVNSIYSSLRNPSVTKMKKILISAVTFIFSCYLF
ncbi:unnamed protein product [Hymenolepis diminuta]|nr:unnamed protein product [Hymenolepis diminuta]